MRKKHSSWRPKVWRPKESRVRWGPLELREARAPGGHRPKAPAPMVNASPRDSSSRGPTRVILSYLLQLIILGLAVVGFYRAYNFSGLGNQLKDVVKSAIQYIEASEYAMSVYMAKGDS
eukprot:s6544_g2.t1